MKKNLNSHLLTIKTVSVGLEKRCSFYLFFYFFICEHKKEKTAFSINEEHYCTHGGQHGFLKYYNPFSAQQYMRSLG